MTRLGALLVVMSGAMSVLVAGGCEFGKRIAITPFYRTQTLPDARVVANIAYVEGPDAHPVKHRLDLFLPDRRDFTTVVFVHGGNWMEGDKSLHVSGADLYANIGRFFANQGYGAAVINYRLLPDVGWQQQPADVARAVQWVHENIARFGGDPGSLVLMGHSAGAQLASLVAADERWLHEAGVPDEAIRGVIAVSGAGYDIADEETYRLFGHSQAWYARRFRTEGSPNWLREGSPVNYLDRDDPPFLLMYSMADKPGVRRQSALMAHALRSAGVWTWEAPISGFNHSGMVIVMSRPDRAPGLVALRFLGLLSRERP